MIYRGPDFLAVEWFGSSPTPFSPLSSQQVVSLFRSSCVSLVGIQWGEGLEGVGEEPKMLRQRESLALYRSSNTVWQQACKKYSPRQRIIILPQWNINLIGACHVNDCYAWAIHFSMSASSQQAVFPTSREKLIQHNTVQYSQILLQTKS
jgi:hypothetical protein